MNAALRQICCCSYKGDVRVREDAMCAIHGLDQQTKQRDQLDGQILACAEGLRDARSAAMAALHLYRRTKKRLADLRKQREAMT
jgi:hypothetical protein